MSMSSPAADQSDIRRMFESKGPPVLFEEKEAQEADGARTVDVRLSRDGEKAPAFLVEPLDEGEHPAVLVLHPAPGDRSFFLKEARELARQGMVSLLIDAPWVDVPTWGRAMLEPGPGRERIVRTVLELRRDLDLLASRDDVDPSRLGFLGMSLGAMLGGVLSGVDERVSAYVLMSGLASFADVAAMNIPVLKGEALENYREVMAPVDPVRYLDRAAPAHLLFQYGRRDVFPLDGLERFAGAGSQPKTRMVYDAGHFLNEEARSDAVDWLVETLGREAPAILETVRSR